MQTALGVDPGLSGALAIISESAEVLAVLDMPVFEVVRGKAKRHDLDLISLCRWIDNNRVDHAFVEQAQAMPGQAAYATGIFFQTYGEVRGILSALRVPLTVVHPKTWKRSLIVPAGKDAARARASQLLPEAAEHWPLKKHDGRAEAALIALWGISKMVREAA